MSAASAPGTPSPRREAGPIGREAGPIGREAGPIDLSLVEDVDGPEGAHPLELDYWRALEQAGFPNRRIPPGRTYSGEAVLCADAARDKIEVHLIVTPDGRIEDIGYRPQTLMGVAAEDTADILCRIVRQAALPIGAVHGLRAERFLEVVGGPARRILFRTGPALSSLYIAWIRWLTHASLERVLSRPAGPDDYVGDLLETEEQAEALRRELNQALAPLGVNVQETLIRRAVRELSVGAFAAVLVHLARPAVTERLVQAGCRFTRNFAENYAGGSA